MTHTQYKADVIIVGAGIAGITAALELLDSDKKIIIFDRDVKENIGGLANWSFGGMFFVNTPLQRMFGMKDSKELAWEDWQGAAQYDEKDYWQKKWGKKYVDECTEKGYYWLKKQGVSFFPIVHWVERGWHFRGNTLPRFHMVWGTGKDLVQKLIKKMLNHPNAKTHLEIKFEHVVDEILMDKGRVVGIKGRDLTNHENLWEAYGEHIIIASGGIGGNIQKVRKYWITEFGTPPEIILNGTSPTADGKMHDAVEKVHGNLSNMHNHWHYAAGVHHPTPHHPNHGLSLVPPKSALWMDYKGKRIGPEPLITAYDTRFLVEQVCKQEKKMSWQIMNLKIANKEFAISGSEHNVAIRDKNLYKFLKMVLFGNKELVNDLIQNCPDFVIANSIEELALKMNQLQGNNDVDVNQLKADVMAYDKEIDLGEENFTDPQLLKIKKAREYRGDKPRTCKFQKIDDPKVYPLIAIREFVVSRKTLGGIETNLECKVIAENGGNQTIPGLYAVGECAGFGGGGMHGKGALEGTFLGGCILTGRTVAETIINNK